MEAVGGFHQRADALAGGVVQFFGHQNTVTLRGPAPYTSAKLVQLREAEALGLLDDHQAGVGHVHADLDHRGRDQDLDLARL